MPHKTGHVRLHQLAAFIAGLAVFIIFCIVIVLWLLRLFGAHHAAGKPAAAAPGRQTSAAPADASFFRTASRARVV